MKKHGLDLGVHMATMLDTDLPTEMADLEMDRAFGGDTNLEKGEPEE